MISVSGCTDEVIEDSSECLKAGESDIKGGVPSSDDLELLKPCCEGLEEISYGDVEFEGQCMFPAGGFGHICAPCGNGKCESEYGENKCNCVKDCE